MKFNLTINKEVKLSNGFNLIKHSLCFEVENNVILIKEYYIKYREYILKVVYLWCKV